MRRSIYLILCLLTSTSLFAQTLKGRVVDVTNSETPLELVNVQLLNSQGEQVSGAVTNNKGIFVISVKELDRNQQYRLVASMVGFTSVEQLLSLSDANMDLGTLQMRTQSEMLEDVTIRGEGKVLANGYTIFPSKAALTQSDTGYDFVKKLMIPDLKVDIINRNIKTVGNDEVLVLINEKRASVEELLTLRSSRVQRVEYIDSPGVEYGSEPLGAVIKVYVKNPESGVQGGLNLTNAVTTFAGENFAFVRYNYKQSEFGLVLDNTYTSVKRRSIAQKDQYKLSDTETHDIDKAGIERPLRYDSNKATIHYNHTKSGAHIFNVALAANWYNSTKRSVSQQITESGLTPYKATTSPTENYISPQLDLFYLQMLTNSSMLAYNLHGTYIDTDYGYQYSEEHPTYGARNYAYTTKGDKKSVINELRYEQELDNVELSLGGRYLYSITKNRYLGSGITDNSLNNHDVYFFGQMAGRLSALRYNLGLGVSMLDTRQGSMATNSWIFRPRLSMTLPIKNWNLQYNFRIDPSAPTLAMLSSVNQRPNAWEVHSGNPDLKAFHKFDNSLTIRAFLGKAFIMVTQVGNKYAIKPIVSIVDRTTEADGTKTFRYTYANIGNSSDTWGTFAIRWGILPDILTLTSTFTYTYMTVANELYKHHLHNPHLSVEADFSLGDWNVMATYYNEDKSLSGEMITINSPNLMLMLRYRLGAWTFGLNAANLFLPYGKRQQIEQINALHSYKQDLQVPSMANVVGVYISWNFATGRHYNGGEASIQNSDTDSGILKF